MLKDYLFGNAAKATLAAIQGISPKTLEAPAHVRGKKCGCQLCQRTAQRLTMKTQIHALAAHIGYAGRSARW